MREKKMDRVAYLYLLGAAFLWGGNWVAVRYAVREMPPLVFVTARTVLAAIVGLLLVIKLKGNWKPALKDIKLIAFLGLVGIFGFNLLQSFGLRNTTAINGSLINAATPMLTIVLSKMLIKEKLQLMQLMGILISFLGVVWVATNGSWTILRSLKFNLGDVMILIAAACWSIYSIYGKKPTLEYSAVAVTAYASLFAALYFLPLGLTQYQLKPVHSISWAGVLAVGYSVSVGVFAQIAWLKGVSLIGPSRASIFMNLLPLSTLAFAALLLGEMITLNQLIGGVFVLGGVYFTTYSRKILKTDC